MILLSKQWSLAFVCTRVFVLRVCEEMLMTMGAHSHYPHTH